MRTTDYLTRFLAVLLLLLVDVSARAHYCGPPVIRCRPGDVITYYIIADVAEDDLSLYDVFNQSDASVAPVVFFTPISPVYGLYVFEARAVGTNEADLFWSFPPNAASGFCVVDVRVTDEFSPDSSGQYPDSATHGDPVNMFTGELVMEEPPDLSPGGPMRLFFARYYASRLQSDGLVKSALGNNWSHNFDWRSITLTNRALVIAPNGFTVHFDRVGANWVLNRPTDLTYQLVASGGDLIFGDPRDNRLYTFNTNGLLTSIRDGKGNTHTLTYTNAIQLHQVSDGLGRALTFEYAGAQLLRRVSDGTRAIGFAHQLIGPQYNLVRATNALGRVTSYTYNNFSGDGSLLTATLLPEGNSFYSQTYDALGRVIQQTRLGTNITRFAYDTTNFVTYATNAQGQVTAYRHSPAGQFLGLTDAAGETLTLTTNALGLRASIASRAGGALGIAYDPASRKPSAVTNVDGAVTFFAYTNRTVAGVVFYELDTVTLPDGSTEKFTYDAVGNLTSHQDAAGYVTRMQPNARGQWLAITNPAGGVISFGYNADGTLATRTTAETGTSSVFYDSLRRPTNAVAADGRSCGVSFDALDRIVALRDERTNTTFFSYDGNDRLTAVTNAAGEVVRLSYDAADRLVTMTDRLGQSVRVGYDSLDQPVALTNRNAATTRFNWDTRQRLDSVTDAGNQPWTFGYDDEARLIQSANPLGDSVGRALNAAGFVTAVTNEANQTVRLTRDVLNRVTSSVDPLGRLGLFAHDSRGLLTNVNLSAVGAAQFEPDALGLLTQLTDQTGSQWRLRFSNLGRLAEVVDPLNRTNSIQFDQRSRPRRWVFADGATQTNRYDAVGYVVQSDFSDGTSFTFAYDSLNRLTNASWLQLTYDAADQVINTVSSGVNFGAAYDAGGRLTNVTYNGGALSVTYSYDSRDRLTQVSDNLSGAQLTFLYDPAGRLTNVARVNGVSGIYDYDAVGRLTRIREGSFLDLQFTLNHAGEIAALNSTAPLSAAPAAGLTTQLTFDAAHQVSSTGYAYDARGRLTASPGHTFVWDAASQLRRVDAVTNTYNGAGNILTRGDAGGTVRYHYNHAIGLAPIVAEQNAGTLQFLRYYVWSPGGQLLYMIDAANGNAVYYYHFDHLGSTLALTSGGGAVTDAYAYSPYGRLAARTGSNPQPFTFVGQFGVRTEPAAGLCHMRARYYDPSSGRFLTPDPVWPRPEDPLSLNPYQYAVNNPLRYTDPLGLFDRESAQVKIQLVMSAVWDSHLRRLGIDLPQIQGAPSLDGAAMMWFNFPALATFLTYYEAYFHLQAGDAYLWAQQRYLHGRYNRMTEALRKNPFLAVNVFRVSRSYDPAGSLLNLPYVPGMPVFNTLAAYEVVGIATFLRGIEGERTAVANYARVVRNPAVTFLLNYQTALGWMGMQPFALGQAILPVRSIPRGVAFVNGQLVRPKLFDLYHEAAERRKLYNYLDDEDIWPEDLVEDLLDRLEYGSGYSYPGAM